MVCRCPNPYCRARNEEQAWHCAKCGCPMDADPVELTADEDKLNLVSIITLAGSFALGLVLMVGAFYSILYDLRLPVSGSE